VLVLIAALLYIDNADLHVFNEGGNSIEEVIAKA